MITITEQPYSIPETGVTIPKPPPVALSDCLRFCLQPDAADAISTPGAFATLVITIPGSPVIPSDGTTFTVWGYDFTVDSGVPFSSDSFDVDALGIVAYVNLANMFYSNIFFNRAVVFTGAVVGLDFELTLTWRECREQPRFSGADMDLAVFTAMGGTAVVTNGVSPVYVEAYRIITRTFDWQSAAGIGVFVGLESEKQCTTVGETCVIINDDVAEEIYTPLPELTSTSFTEAVDLAQTMMKFFSLDYGWTYRESCISKSGTIKKSDKVLVLNAAFEDTDPYQMRRYWYNHPEGLPPDTSTVEFLTGAPKAIKLCYDSIKWLWMLNNWQDDFGQYDLRATFTVYDLDGNIDAVYYAIINDGITDAHAWHDPVNFNVSPSYLVDTFSVDLSTVSKYEVSVAGTNTLDINDVYFNATEYLTFIPVPCCDGQTDIYFLNPCSGIDTFIVQVDKVEVLQSGTEIKVEIPCGTSRFDAATNGGRTLVNLRAYTKYTFSANLGNNEANSRWIKHLRQSPQAWVKITDDAGFAMAKKLLLEPGAVSVNNIGAGLLIEFTGYLQDIPTQKGTEKRLQ